VENKAAMVTEKKKRINGGAKIRKIFRQNGYRQRRPTGEPKKGAGEPWFAGMYRTKTSVPKKKEIQHKHRSSLARCTDSK